MDNSFRENETSTQQADGFLTISLRVANGILHWLAGFIRLTEEEKTDVGIYMGDQYDR